MNKIKLHAFLLLGFGYIHLLQHKAHAQQNSTALPAFERIQIGYYFEAELIPADRNAIYVDLPSEEADRVGTEVKNNTLVLSCKEGKDPVKVKIYFKTLHDIHVSGAAKVSNSDTLLSDNMSLEVDGAASAKLSLRVQNLRVKASGASKIVLNGSATSAVLDVNGAANADASGLRTIKSSVEGQGIAKVKVNASETLSARASGASKIIFSGEPLYRNIAIDGMGSVKDAKDGQEYTSESEAAEPLRDGGDTTEWMFGKKKLMIIEEPKESKSNDPNKRRRMKRVYAGFELGVNSMVTPGMSFSFDNRYNFLNNRIGQSWFFGLNFFEADAHLIRNKLALTSGLGIQWSNYNFDGNNYLAPGANTLSSATDSTVLSMNKLRTFDLNVPLLIKIAPGNAKRSSAGVHFAAGVILHYVLTSSVVTKTEQNGYEHRQVFEDDFNINPFRVDATVRVGYNRLKLFANYSLTPYFDRSKAPDVRVFAAGLTLVGF